MIRCGNTKTHMDQGVVHHHDTVAQVRLCHARLDSGLPSLEEELAAIEYAAEWVRTEGSGSDDYAGPDPDAEYERFLEINPQYAHEAEMDEQRAASGLRGTSSW